MNDDNNTTRFTTADGVPIEIGMLVYLYHATEFLVYRIAPPFVHCKAAMNPDIHGFWRADADGQVEALGSVRLHRRRRETPLDELVRNAGNAGGES